MSQLSGTLSARQSIKNFLALVESTHWVTSGLVIYYRLLLKGKESLKKTML